jgi:hypothetical protein
VRLFRPCAIGPVTADSIPGEDTVQPRRQEYDLS